MGAFDTDNLILVEPSNLYFTNERVDDRVGAPMVGGDGITATYDDAGGTLTIAISQAIMLEQVAYIQVVC